MDNQAEYIIENVAPNGVITEVARVKCNHLVKGYQGNDYGFCFASIDSAFGWALEYKFTPFGPGHGITRVRPANEEAIKQYDGI